MQEVMAVFGGGQVELYRKINSRWYLWTRASGPPEVLSRVCAAALEVSEFVGAGGGWPIELARDSFYPKPPVAAITRSGTFAKDSLNGRLR